MNTLERNAANLHGLELNLEATNLDEVFLLGQADICHAILCKQLNCGHLMTTADLNEGKQTKTQNLKLAKNAKMIKNAIFCMFLWA